MAMQEHRCRTRLSIGRLNIGTHAELVTVQDEPVVAAPEPITQRLRHKRPRRAVDDDDDVVMTNGNGH